MQTRIERRFLGTENNVLFPSSSHRTEDVEEELHALPGSSTPRTNPRRAKKRVLKLTFDEENERSAFLEKDNEDATPSESSRARLVFVLASALLCFHETSEEFIPTVSEIGFSELDCAVAMSTQTLRREGGVESAKADPEISEDEGRMEKTSVPVVRLDVEEEVACHVVRTACVEYGFFYLEGHGVEERMLREHLEQCRRFFELPTDSKRSCLLNESHRGYTPHESETLDPENQSGGDTKEGYYIGKEMKAQAEHALPLHGPNVWPNEELLPGWRSHMLRYLHSMHGVANKLLRLLALALELPPTYFDDRFSDPIMTLRLLHYQPTVSRPSEGVLGAGAHTDYGMLTLLLTDSEPGLQVRLDERWVDVLPRPGALIVNVGDMLERWTNGIFRSALHRVVNQNGKERYSSPFFFETNFDTVVECLPSCCKDIPAKYPPVVMGEHLLSKYAKTYKAK